MHPAPCRICTHCKTLLLLNPDLANRTDLKNHGGRKSVSKTSRKDDRNSDFRADKKHFGIIRRKEFKMEERKKKYPTTDNGIPHSRFYKHGSLYLLLYYNKIFYSW